MRKRLFAKNNIKDNTTEYFITVIIINKFFVSVFAVVYLFSLGLPSHAISAESHIAVNCDDLSSYSEHNGYKRMEIASVTKIMTAVVSLEISDDLSEMVDIADEAVGTEGSSVYLKYGESLTVEELIYAVMLNSANDAAVALAIHLCGTVDAFVELMNIKARALCMNNTVYATPNGLPAEGQYSTAHDQAILACYALSVDRFEKICSTYTHSISYNGVANGRYLRNHNKLLKNYNGCIGMKTGFTKSAGRCLVTCARRKGVTLVCVTLNAPDDWSDHRALLDKGFSLYIKNTE